MKNKYWFIIIILFLLIGGSVFFFLWNFNNKSENQNVTYQADKTEAEVNTANTNTDTNTSVDEEEAENNTAESATPKEEEITSFSTKIITKDSSRQKNISITCSTLNDTLVANGETFSFCNTVGQASTAKGYEEADIFDSNGKKKKGLGGGNCQVSTTLYNAVLNVPSLTVTERHKHSNKVPYIQDGKDAAVAYGSYDLKFRNDYGSTIKIKAESTENDVTIRLLKIS